MSVFPSSYRNMNKQSPKGRKRMLEGVLSSVAEFFSLQSGEKVKTGMKQKLKEGLWPTGASYGYKNVREKLSTGKVRSWVEINWEEAKWVIRAFELFATGNYSTISLAQILRQEGFPVRKYKRGNDKLHASFIERLLRNKFFIGIIEWDGLVNPNGKHELFLDRQLFDKVQSILDMRLGGGSRKRKHFSILKGPAFCQECNSRITMDVKETTTQTIRYLRCLKSQNSERVQCSQEYPHELEILKQVDELLRQIKLKDTFVIKLRKRIRKTFADEQQVYERARMDILNITEEIKRKKKNLVLQMISKDNASTEDLDIFASVQDELNVEEKYLNEQLEKIENKITSVVRTIQIALAIATDCHYAYKKAEPELKAMLIQTLFKKIYIRDKQITQVVLNEPLDYLCLKRLQKNPVFDLTSNGGSSGDRTHDKRLKRPLALYTWDPVNRPQDVNNGKAAVHSLKGYSQRLKICIQNFYLVG